MFRLTQQNWRLAGRIRSWIAVCCVLFLAASGVVHVTGHALQPLAGTGIEISMTVDGTSHDGQTQLDIDSFHCHGCAIASMTNAPAADNPVIIGGTVVSRPLYQALQQRQHADPPPPRSLT